MIHQIIHQLINPSSINQSSHSAWIVFSASINQSINQSIDEFRKDYACVACHKKFSYRDVQAIKQPIEQLWQTAINQKNARQLTQCLDTLYLILSINQSINILTAYHPLIMKVYVLAYSLSSHLDRKSVV